MVLKALQQPLLKKGFSSRLKIIEGEIYLPKKG